MRKKSIFIYTILVVLAILTIFFAVKSYNFLSISSNIDYFQTDEILPNSHLGILDDNYYRVKNNYYEGFNSDNNKLFTIKVQDIADIIYDKYIYIFHADGKIKVIDRSSGKEIRSTDIKTNIKKAILQNDYILIFGEDKIQKLDKKLNTIESISNLKNPIAYDISNLEAYIELFHINGVINSVLTVKDKDNIRFQLNSTNETFINLKFINNNLVVLSNNYLYLIKENKVHKKIFIGKLSAIDFRDNKVAMVDNQTLRIFNESLEEIDNKVLDKEVEKLSIRKNSIIMLSENSILVYENGNLLEEVANDWIDSFSGKDAYYVVFKNKIQKVNAY